MLVDLLVFPLLLIGISPLYFQLALYSVAYRVIVFEPAQTAIDAFVSKQVPLWRRLCKRSLNSLHELRQSDSPPTVEGILFRRRLAALIPAAFVVAVMLGSLGNLDQPGLIAKYIVYLIVFVACFYFAWNFGRQLEINH